jgi:hypothetical protein
VRCFTDAEIRAGLVAVILAGPEADAFAVFLAGAGVRRTNTDDDHPRYGQPDHPKLETTQRPDR